MMERFNMNTSLPEGDDENESGNGADPDPDPFLLGQSGSLNLIQILRELVQVLIRKLGQTLVHLFLRETMRGQHLRDLRIGRDIADEREIGIARCDALIRGGLRGHRSGE
jgi:hypothetical protein